MPLATALGGLFAGLLGRRGGLPLTDLQIDPPPPPQPKFDARALYETLLSLNGGMAPAESTPFRLYSTRPATAEDTRAMFAPAKPLPGVVPEGFAFDSINNPMDYSGYGGLTEGMRWLGFPYMAELAQRTEYRRISETIAKDMTRRWFRLQATGDDDKTDKIKALEESIKFHKLQEKFTLLALLDGFFGRAHLYIDTGYTDDRDMLKLPLPIDPRTIIRGGLKGLRVVEPMWCYPNALNASDPLRENFYLPQTWWVMGKEIHRTRVLPFIGREMPDMMKPAYSYAGLSLSQMAKPYVDNWLRTRQSVSDLVHSFSTPVLMTNMGAVLNGGATDQMKMRAWLFNFMRDNNNLMVLDKNTEDFKNVSVPIGALDHLQAQSQEHMASAVGIPLVVLLGISPSGLNATSEGELQVWAQFIRAAQGSFFDANLVTILNIMQLDLFGEIDPAITHAWEPLRELSEEEVSAAEKTQADVDTAYINAGVLSPDEIRQRLSGEADSPYQGLDLDTPAPPPPMQEQDPLNSMGDPMKAAANDPGTPGAVGGAPAGGSAAPIHAGPGHMGAAGGSAAALSPNKGARDDEEIKPGMPNTGHTMVRTQDPNAHIHVHMGPNDRARVKLGADGAFHIATDAFNPSEARDPGGEWTGGGGGAPKTESHSITGLPPGKLPRELARMSRRGGYEMSAVKLKKGEFDSSSRYEVTVTAKAPANIKTVGEGHRAFQYDPELAEVETLNADEPTIARKIGVVKKGLPDRLPIKRNDEHMYRGMDSAEFEDFQKTGQIKSKADYNMGGQEGLTYWSTDPDQAESYANSFAPAEHKPTFDKPAYVMVAKRVGPEDETRVPGTGANEIGVKRPVEKADVVEIWRGRVAVMDAGGYSVTDRDGEFEGGSGSSPRADVVWEKVGQGEMAGGGGSGRAAKGGEHGVNQFFYKGGQFLPSTTAPPGTWRVKIKGKTKVLGPSNQLVEPGKFEMSPTPFSRSIFNTIRELTDVGDDGKLTLKNLNPAALEAFGVDDPSDPENGDYNKRDLIDLYNKGARWVLREPQGVEIISKGEAAEQAHDKEPWDESKHPRGQPENAGEFGPGGGGAKQPEVKAGPSAAPPASKPAPSREASPAAAVQPKPEATPAAPAPEQRRVGVLSNQHHGVEFYSPSVEEHMDLTQATAGLHSERQHLLNTAAGEIDQKLGLHATNHDAIGAWSDGAENSIMTEMDGGSWDELRASVAMKAALANQKDVLVFQEAEGGKEHLFSFPATGSVEKIHQDLLADGVAFHTIVPTQGGATVYAVDMGYDGDATSQAVLKAAERYGTTPTDQAGRAEFLVGDNKGTTAAEQRHIAQLAYGKVIDKSGVPDAATVWKGLRPTYGEAFSVTEYPATETTSALPGTAPDSHPATISSRRPTSVDAVEGDEYRRADLAGLKADPVKYKFNMELLRNAKAYPQLRAEETEGKSPDEIAQAAIAMAKSNLRFLYEHAPEAVREQGPQWYEGAHKFAAAKAKEYDIPIASAAGVYAALSPQKLWAQNVKQGDAVLDAYFHHQDTPWSPEMDATAARIWKPKDDRILSRIKGKTLGELQLPAEKAMWIRTYDEAHDPAQSYNRLAPDGTILGTYYNLNGSKAKNGWQNTNAIAAAIVALESGGNRERISLAMGDRHKVRSFYNNILDPKSGNEDVTMDTHAVGAALMYPSTALSTAVNHSLATSPEKEKQEPGFVGARSSGVTGASGTYGLWADAYRELAHELHIEPRVLQSVTWEAKRKLFDDRMTKETVGNISKAWDAYHDGSRTLEQTQNEVLRLAGGMDKPEAGLPAPPKEKPPARARRAKSAKP